MKIFRLILCAALCATLCAGILQSHIRDFGQPLALAPDQSGTLPFKYITHQKVDFGAYAITTWDTKNKKPIAIINAESIPSAATWMPTKDNNKFFAVGLMNDDSVRSVDLYDGYSGNLIRSFIKENKKSEESKENKESQQFDVNYRGIAFNTTEKYLASSIFENTIDIIDVASFKLVLTLKGHNSWVRALSFCPLKDKEDILASGSMDKNICIWDAKNGKLLKTLKGHEDAVIGDVVWHPTEYFLASCGADNTVRIWNIAEGRQQLILRHNGTIWAAAWSPNGRYLAAYVFTGIKNHIRVWDLERERYKDFDVLDGALIGWFSEKEIVCAYFFGQWEYIKPFNEAEWEEVEKNNFDEN